MLDIRAFHENCNIHNVIELLSLIRLHSLSFHNKITWFCRAEKKKLRNLYVDDDIIFAFIYFVFLLFLVVVASNGFFLAMHLLHCTRCRLQLMRFTQFPVCVAEIIWSAKKKRTKCIKLQMWILSLTKLLAYHSNDRRCDYSMENDGCTLCAYTNTIVMANVS